MVKIKRFVKPALLLATLVALLVPTVVLAASGGGTGTLHAWGTGKGVVQGDGSISASGNGDLWIKDNAGDAYIYVRGEKTKFHTPNGWVHYEGFHGYALVRGSDVTVAISGDHLRLHARGTGRFALRGQGGYETEGSGWTLDPVLINATPGEIYIEQP
jgi:hypothetical protein